jgi:hydrogenase 3 maturation protease
LGYRLLAGKRIMTADDWRARLTKIVGAAEKIVLLGVGNELMADDGAGCLVARRLRKSLGRKIADRAFQVFDAGTAPENFTGLIRRDDPDLVLLVDAAGFGQQPGTIAVIEHGQFESSLPSTHSLPLSAMIRYLEETTRADVAVLLIQAGSVQLDGAMTPEVLRSVEEAVDILSGAARLPVP